MTSGPHLTGHSFLPLCIYPKRHLACKMWPHGKLTAVFLPCGGVTSRSWSRDFTGSQSQQATHSTPSMGWLSSSGNPVSYGSHVFMSCDLGHIILTADREIDPSISCWQIIHSTHSCRLLLSTALDIDRFRGFTHRAQSKRSSGSHAGHLLVLHRGDRGVCARLRFI